MFFFEGSKCSVCGNVFDEKDDIVTCPECGTPHHRACWEQNGTCANSDKHAEDFKWRKSENKAERSGINYVECEVCGENNPEGRLFCARCGSPLSKDNTYNPDYQGRASGQTGYYSLGSMPGISDGDTVRGVPVGDLKRFIGAMWFYYIPKFIAFDKLRRSMSFNLAACVLHGIWFISRKMYVLGGLVLSVMIGITALRMYYTPALMPAYEQWLNGDISAMNDFVIRNPLASVGLMCGTALQFLVYILSGVFGDRLYMSHCVKNVKRINGAAKTADEFNDLLESRGGASMLLALIAGAMYFGVQYYMSAMII